MEDFRILNIMDTTMEETNQRVLVVELGLIKYQENDFFSEYKIYTFSPTGEQYVFDYSTELLNKLKKNIDKEEIITIDHRDFIERYTLKNGNYLKMFYRKNLRLIDTEVNVDYHEIISYELENNLENAFEDLYNNLETPLVIGHLQSKDKDVNIYLIAKIPDEDTFYGIVETQYNSEKKITGILLENILSFNNLKEVAMIPFRVVPYIENSTKQTDV